MSGIEREFDSSTGAPYTFWSVAKDATVQVEIALLPALFLVALLAVRPKKFKLVNFKLVILCHFLSDFIQTGTFFKGKE